jgi:aspartyl-tRNA(Asn)/glutamyl-tRNA(Gln) amidotransferase subunit C
VTEVYLSVKGAACALARRPLSSEPVSVSSDDVRHIARLARLELTDEEVERFRRELSTILGYVEQLELLDAGSAGEPSLPDQPLRPDAVEEWGDVRPLHEAAPDFEDGYFRVPRVIE